ncbi:MAG: hypothetical protein Q4G43_07290 [Mobilicoccus sp.]|nr:hypothetical protein [Mobilicoccus sp.]
MTITRTAGAIFLTGALLGTLAACGSADGNENAAPAPAPTAASTPAPAAPTTDAPTTETPSTDAPTGEATENGEVGTAFTAFGTDTSWRAVVDGTKLEIEGEGAQTRTVTVERSAFAKGVEFTGTENGAEVALVVRDGECKDASGQDTGMTAKLTQGGKTVEGCAVEGAVERAGQ